MKRKASKKKKEREEMIRAEIDVWVRPRPDCQEPLFGKLPLFPQLIGKG